MSTVPDANEYARVLDIIERAHAVRDLLPGSDSQYDFIEDMHDRIRRYGSRVRLSPKQTEWINRIGEDLFLYEQEQDEDAVEPVDEFMRRRS